MRTVVALLRLLHNDPGVKASKVQDTPIELAR